MIKEKVREILIKNFKGNAHMVHGLSDQDDFVKQHLFDSIELINIVLAVEHEFNIKIEVADLAKDQSTTWNVVA